MRDHLGYATVAILGAVKQGHRFGLDIMRQTGLPSGTVYPTLARAERSGLVRSRWEDRETADREARPRRRHYQLTAAGDTALGRAARRLDALTWPARRQVRKART
jgi:PadR family transcriptional regulator, regulatory protein PadR